MSDHPEPPQPGPTTQSPPIIPERAPTGPDTPFAPPEPPILVSACLAGLRTRHDGRGKPDPRIVDLVASGRAIPVCPEQLGGLPTPREPANLVPGEGIRVRTISGVDVTENFRRGAEETLHLARLTGARRAILKERSPSCGTACTWQVDPASGEPRLVEGQGVTARLLRESGIEIFSEEPLPLPGGDATGSTNDEG